MPAKVIDVADAIKSLLTSAVEEAEGTIERGYTPRHDLKDLQALQKPAVTIVPATMDSARQSRASYYRDMAVDVGVQQRAATQEEQDAVLLFAESLSDLLWGTPVLVGVTLLNVQTDPLFWPEHLEEDGVLTTVMRATYREGRTQ